MHIDGQMETFLITLLKENIPAQLYYHNFEHALYVREKALEIATHEHCSDAEKRLLNAAALWHDAGHVITYYGHEEQSCLLVKKYLPDFGYSDDEITNICGMIMATKVPQSPHGKLEEIISDADLEYMGTAAAAEKAELLFKEMQAIDPALTKKEWDEKQISFLQNHRYFTEYCRREKEPEKKKYLEQLFV